MGVIVDLWAWALELGPKEEAPTGELVSPNALRRLAASVEFWQEKSVDLAEALQDVGLIEWDADGCNERVRVRGLDRYRRTWEKNKRRKVPETGAENAGPAPQPARKTYTQTQTQKLLPTEVVVPPPTSGNPIAAMGAVNIPSVVQGAEPDRRAEPLPRVAVSIQKPTKAVELWDGDDFWAWAQDRRQAGGRVAERGKPRGLGSWFSAALMTEGVTAAALKEAFYAYSEDPFWDAKGFPFAGFVSQWDKYTRKESHARTA
jgi:hypothetical protein